MAETEKYPHVTYFFNGGVEKTYKNEDRILIPSPKVKTYDLKPEMSAKDVEKKLVASIKNNSSIIEASCDLSTFFSLAISENTSITPDSIYGISKYIGEMFIKQILYKTKIKTSIFRIFNTYGPGENLNFLKKGMVSIYSSYVWRKKPIIVKGSLKRFRNYQYIDRIAGAEPS